MIALVALGVLAVCCIPGVARTLHAVLGDLLHSVVLFGVWVAVTWYIDTGTAWVDLAVGALAMIAVAWTGAALRGLLHWLGR